MDEYDETENKLNKTDYEPAEAPAEAENEAPKTVFSEPESFAANPGRVDGEYHYTMPEARRSAYSDAGYVPSEAAPEVPRSYRYSPVTEKPKKEKKPRSGMGTGGVIALCLVCAILGGLLCGAVSGLFRKSGDTSAEEPAASRSLNDAAAPAAKQDDTVITVAAPESGTRTVTTNRVASGEELSATEIYYDLAVNQVVGITTEITYTNYFGFTSSGAVSGSGFIISSDGYILTNNHVIEDAVAGGYEVKVLTYDGTEYIADVVGYEEDNDVAVLKIAGTDFHAATVGDSEGMLVGEKVYAVGNPLGELEYTMTSGMVSALDREISIRDNTSGGTKTINMFQIDAAINSGNSGGPVYNSRGEVIGIATSKYSDTGIEGLGFAIPINDAVKIANDLISDGYVRGKAYLGVSAGTVSASAAQYYGLVQGAIVNSVNKGSCAEKAGLKDNDIIVALDDHEIASLEDLSAAKKDYRAGDSAVLKVYRGGDYVELTVVFDEETPALLEEDSRRAAEEQEKQQQQQPRIIPNDGYGSYYDFFNDFFGGFPFGR